LFAVEDSWNRGKSGVFTMFAQLSPMAGRDSGETVERDTAIGPGRAKNGATGEAREVGAR
jgi:hypothetical protein